MLVFVVVFVLCEPGLRVLVAQSIYMQPRVFPRSRPCGDVRADGCVGGAATMLARVREEENTAKETLKVMGYDRAKFVHFHPVNFKINSLFWDRVGVDCSVLSDPDFQSQAGLLSSTMAWLESVNRQVVVSNFDFAGDNTNMIQFLTVLNRIGWMETPSGVKVGVIAVMGTKVYTSVIDPYIVTLEFARVLRRRGADVVMVMCMGFGDFWEDDWERLAEADVDVVVPPDCSTAPCNGTQGIRRVNDTFILPRGDSGAAGEGGEAFISFDFTRVDGRLVPDAWRSVNLLEPVPEKLRGGDYDGDLDWLQGQVTAALQNNPVIGYSTQRMPDSKVLDQDGSVKDEPCRRDVCPLGLLAGEAVQRLDPTLDVVVTNGGSLRAGWEEGIITKNNVYAAMPFENLLCVFNTTGPELWRMVSNYASKVTPAGHYNSTAPGRGGFIQPYGLRYTFDPTRPPQDVLVSLEFFDRGKQEWEAVRRTRHYKVAMSDFLCQGGDGHDWYMIPGTHRVLQTKAQSLIIGMILHLKTFTPATPPSWVRINSKEPSFLLPRLTASDCLPSTYFDSEWEECAECPPGGGGQVGCPLPPVDAGHWRWVLVGCAVFLVVIGIPVGCYIKMNWRKVRRLTVMEVTVMVARDIASALSTYQVDAAELVLEEEGAVLPLELSKSFLQLLQNLRMYKPYLPQSCLVREDDVDGGGSDIEPSETHLEGVRRERVSFIGDRSMGSRSGWTAWSLRSAREEAAEDELSTSSRDVPLTPPAGQARPPT
eukprot:Hpha_TRINITY_DN15423_c5_g3::TRINITY_DN15423_c5_g3_i1::g.174643::m.174643